MTTNNRGFVTFPFAGMALDPIHVGTGGARLGRVDNTIVRDPVTRIPKIPGSSLAGVMRAYTAMAKGKYPKCAGLGQPERDGAGGHCGKADCPVCTVFGFAKGIGASGGFAGLAAFSDMQVLLFPVASQLGPQWITCPMALRQTSIAEFAELGDLPEQQVVYRETDGGAVHMNLGWLLLPVKTDWKPLTANDQFKDQFKALGIPNYIISRLAVVSDKLFSHIVNSNLEVRTSVAIDPATGAAEEGALFTYEALPRGTVLFWEVICRNPKHFKIDRDDVKAVDSPEKVRDAITDAHSYLEHLGIGGMGSRGMGRLRVLATKEPADADKPGKEVS
ncbi:CRISPR-associated protein Cmr4 [Desulfacinum infernum DSM 9756]|jgi:CRISPR-associated protein Cmr4|uniref:CRISPR-associated protein Cmr4 n=1 Tax=Desulfacinum infernum DSM 9756 TaxID=1121391 RepID=A0A1M4Z5D6_9BACT|nr:type III-B CRISPR module RAMP protein Cmr4 [Desulfacinum infernum]MBC7358355.1 type III-B CRISPR module RAMP protein Cmr4 [Desulfacinum sp.]SHF13264.1 CRISPR-associated protein Cmr4 [Desulfacinum infernum DSM 9756]